MSPAASRAGDEIPDLEMPSASAPQFYEAPVPADEDDDLLFGDTECFLAFPDQKQVWEMTLHETQVDMDNLPSAQQALEYVMLATPERKQRVEVRMRDLRISLHGLRAKKWELGLITKLCDAWPRGSPGGGATPQVSMDPYLETPRATWRSP